MSGREEALGDDAAAPYAGAGGGGAGAGAGAGAAGDADDGLVARSVRYLFHEAAQRRDARFSLRASYVEIYNEGVYDLVHFQRRSLPVKWDPAYGFYVQVCGEGGRWGLEGGWKGVRGGLAG